MFQGLPFAARLSIYIVVATTTVFLCVFGYSYTQAKRSLIDISLKNAATLMTATKEKIESTLQNVEQVPLYIAHRLAAETFTPTQVENTLFQFIVSHPDVYGGTMAFASGALSGAPERYSPYFYKHDGRIIKANLADDGYAYWAQDWYKETKQQGMPLWSEPYFDEGGGNALMATFSVPVYRGDLRGGKNFFAIITADISIEWLQAILKDMHIYETGHAFILSRKGELIAQSKALSTAQEHAADMHMLSEHDSALLQELRAHLSDDQEGMISFKSAVTQQSIEVLYTPLPSSDWILVLRIPTHELFEELQQQSLLLIPLCLLGIISITIVVSSLAYGATKPLRELSQKTKDIAKGTLDIVLPAVKHHDEIGQLTEAFDNMRMALKHYIVDLTHATASKERIESELKIAQNIQANFLAKTFPPFPDRHDFDIYASLSPAREVGGDFYEFILLDSSKLFFAVGDVSGKGVPAALVMAVTKTLMKGIAAHEHSPKKILGFVNNELAKDNEICMFVTAFCGILNIVTGELIYSNAGHNAPILLRDAQIHAYLHTPKSIALGILEDAPYQNERVHLAPNDTLFLFTDGVTEAMSPENEQFGNERLHNALMGEKNVRERVEIVNTAILQHAHNVEQFDDITLMTLLWRGGQ